MFNKDLFMLDEDELSMNSNFGFGDNAFYSRNMFNPFSLELDSDGPSYSNLNLNLPQP